MTLPPGVAELREQFRIFDRSVFRLETLQSYAGSEEDPARHAFVRGEGAPPPNAYHRQWVDRLRAHYDAGRTQQRVHVVREPLSEYLIFELTWQYGPHVAAGEDIRIIPVTDDWPADVPRRDFWLFDSQRLFDLDYDASGTWLGARRIADPDEIAQACLIRDAALRRSVPWADYVATKPALLQRMPKDDDHA